MTGKEYVRAETGTYNTRMNIFTWVISMYTAQVIWIGSLLSIGYLNVASLALVLYMVSMTIAVHHFNGTLSRKILIRDIVFFSGFSIIILAISSYI